MSPHSTRSARSDRLGWPGAREPTTVGDRFTYQQPALPSVGFRHVLVNGTPVVVDGVLRQDTFPGRGVRAAVP